MIERMQFADEPAGQVTVQIDNQIESLEIESVIKMPTKIHIIDQVDTSLYTPININMLITTNEWETESITDEIEEEPLESGFVNISITNLTKSITYEHQRVSFRDGIIQTTMTDKLDIGEYLLTVDYAGNRFYEPTQMPLQFIIGKREVICQYHNNVVGGYPDEKMEVPITLFDALNGKTINNCMINYNFNGTDYVTFTNHSGYANLTFNMPSVDTDSCAMNIIANDESVIEELLTDTDANVFWTPDGILIPYEPNTIDTQQFTYEDGEDVIDDVPELITAEIIEEEEDEEEVAVEDEIKYNVYIYELTINIDNSIYTMNEEKMLLAVNKFDTKIAAYFTKDDEHQKLIVEGDVLNYNNYITNNVEYGIVELYFPDIDYHQQMEIDQYGHYVFEMNYTDINKTYNNRVMPYTAQFYSPNHTTKIKIYDIEGQELEDILEFEPDYTTKKSIDFLAIVTDDFSQKPVTESMVSFVIKQGEKEVYRYVTEVNESGEAYISFDISTAGTFTIQAFYHPMFNLLASSSQVVEYDITESIEDD